MRATSLSATSLSMLALSFMIASCGGGGDSSTPSQAATNTASTNTTTNNTDTSATTTAQNNTPRVIDYYGDSTIRGCETNTDCAGQAPITAPQAFDAALPRTFSHTTRNNGIDGTDACQLLAGQDSYGNNVYLPWAQQLASTTATHVIINHGINDLIHAQNGQGGPEADHNIATYQQCLTRLAQLAKDANKKVIFETPNPITAGDLTPYADVMKAVAASMGAPVIDQFSYLFNKYGGQISSIVPDGLHPADAVYVEKGQFAAKAFSQACGNFTCDAAVVSQ